jgi:hypothetical protein
VNELVTTDLKHDARVAAYRDAKDHPTWTQHIEAAKNIFVAELRAFFDERRVAGDLVEMPTIQKYTALLAAGRDGKFDPYETAVHLIRSFPDLEQALPLVAVTTAPGQDKRVGLGNSFVAHTQIPCRVRGSKVSPFTGLFPAGATEILRLETEDPAGEPIVSELTFTRGMFADYTAVTLDELVRAVNAQALYVRGKKVSVPATPGQKDVLEIHVGGPKGHIRPNHVTVLAGTTQALLDATGLAIGQTDNSDNPDRPVMNRHGRFTEISVAFDVGADDDNARTELSDLVAHFLSVHLEKRAYTLYGRGVFDERYPLEHVQIVLKGPMSISGESDVPRPEGDSLSKIYVNRFSMPVSIRSYVDRRITPRIPSVLSIDDVSDTGQAADAPMPS